MQVGVDVQVQLRPVLLASHQMSLVTVAVRPVLSSLGALEKSGDVVEVALWWVTSAARTGIAGLPQGTVALATAGADIQSKQSDMLAAVVGKCQNSRGAVVGSGLEAAVVVQCCPLVAAVDQKQSFQVDHRTKLEAVDSAFLDSLHVDVGSKGSRRDAVVGCASGLEVPSVGSAVVHMVADGVRECSQASPLGRE